MTSRAPLRIVAVADEESTAKALRAALAPSDSLHLFTFEQLGADRDGPAPRAVASATDQADAVLVEWDPPRAPEVGAVCLRLRAADTLIAAVGEYSPGDHVAALAVGADRFHGLPLSASLLRAQVIAHRRHGLAAEDRRRSDRPAWARDRRVHLGLLHLDWAERTARVGDHPLPLTPRQFEVLALFAARHREVLSRDRVLEDVWGFEFDTGTNVVDVYVHHLRRVLSAHGLGDRLQTVRGRGYRLDVASGAAGDGALRTTAEVPR